LTALMSISEQLGPVNLGTEQEISIVELAETICELTGKPKNFEFHPDPVDDPAQRRPDISLARSKLDWRPEISLAEGLRKTIDYFDNRLADSDGC